MKHDYISAHIKKLRWDLLLMDKKLQHLRVQVPELHAQIESISVKVALSSAAKAFVNPELELETLRYISTQYDKQQQLKAQYHALTHEIAQLQSNRDASQLRLKSFDSIHQKKIKAKEKERIRQYEKQHDALVQQRIVR